MELIKSDGTYTYEGHSLMLATRDALRDKIEELIGKGAKPQDIAYVMEGAINYEVSKIFSSVDVIKG